MAEVLVDIPVAVDRGEVLRLAGYKRGGRKPAGRVQQVLENAICQGLSLASPKAVCRWVRVQGMDQTSLTLEEGFTLNVGAGARFWKGTELLAVALCSIGTALEERVSMEFARGDYPLALMLDCVGSAAAEAAADYVNHLICQRARELGLGVGRRMSPGYGKWDLREQKVLFSLLPAGRIGVSLNDYSIMYPRKSVSFCAGVGREVCGEKEAVPCRHCNMAGCQYRVGSPQRRRE